MKIYHYKMLIHLLLTLMSVMLFDQCTPKDKYTESLRIALFNIKELTTQKITDVDETGNGLNSQLRAAAKIIQKINPDILIINEIDQDYKSIRQGLHLNALRFQKAYLSKGDSSLQFAYTYTAPCNTGIISGFDLNKDGIIAGENDIGTREYGGDCFGYGSYPGQYAMALFSNFPIDTSGIRTFQKFLWKDLPGNHLPVDFYGDDAINTLRLSSKSHWDVPVIINGNTVHLFLSHPTPPVFDGDEDRNGRRNFDEIKFWVDYMANNKAIYDDNGVHGGYHTNEPFIIIGDLNASLTSDSEYDGQVAINQLLNNTKIKDSVEFLISKGALEGRKPGPPDYYERSTAKFSKNLIIRSDYIFVSKNVEVDSGAVFWPGVEEDPQGHQLAEMASDHRLVWLDVTLK